ncbi:DUF3592 domain-containing protein [Verrucomicrobiaceae bacterium R5-34]|uniref:DUF3592 domain-containing protein n=1 Tax=Oceaniferula flava TaxID=2800421 RepID=A0AAE2S9A7_9BACT|nr:DUF3592 domain-containing protein [Oceaniferula flavus]MBK1829413.1 DUF3592 domain-containing protein [Verrucomicrobiaceae bacterium R5-34]MBK1853640.1 DUF3592 domain-containing protein [Oceaniferula flavus]MBM1134945.1 DUF3592 domain-containing protein [Oceaniferula flavus]
MKNSQAALAAWCCLLFLVAAFGVVQLKQLITLVYDHLRSQQWESVEGVVLDDQVVSQTNYQHTGRYGRSGSVNWITGSSDKVVYDWQGGEESIFIPSRWLTESGDVVDVAYSDAAYPERIVRYRNFPQRVLWKSVCCVVLLLGPVWFFRMLSSSKRASA